MRFARALASILLVGAACTGGGSDGDGRANGGTEPQLGRHGTVIFGVLGQPATLDPYSPIASDLTHGLVAPLYPSLFRLTPSGEAEPFLAEDLEHRAGGVFVTLADMSWSDGEPIGPRDVVTTWRRAEKPSGLALFSRARALDGGVLLSGGPSDPALALAVRSPILRRGEPGRHFGGPFVLADRVPGLEMTFKPNPEWTGEGPDVERLVVQHIASVDIMLGLLKEGDLDAAAVPSSVNLGERLERLGLEYDAALGWESVGVTGDLRYVAGAIDRSELADGLIKADGRVTDTPWPQPGEVGAEGPGPVRAKALPSIVPLAIPRGDELLFLLQRAVARELGEADVLVELWEEEIDVLYGRGSDEAAVELRRIAGDPLGEPLSGGLMIEPLFQVRTYIAYREGIGGIEVNPSVAGPLWNAQRWVAP